MAFGSFVGMSCGSGRRPGHCERSAGAQREGQGTWILTVIATFGRDPTCRPPIMLRHQYSAYHALIRLANRRCDGRRLLAAVSHAADAASG